MHVLNNCVLYSGFVCFHVSPDHLKHVLPTVYGIDPTVRKQIVLTTLLLLLTSPLQYNSVTPSIICGKFITFCS